MAWNEPGSGKKDPWSGGKGDQGPPDLDAVVRKMQDKFGGLLGRRRSSSTPGGGGSGGMAGLVIILVVALLAWIGFGIYIIDEGKRGVVLRFGAYLKTTQPGPHWRPLFIDTYDIVDLQAVRTSEIGYQASLTGRQQARISKDRESLMLTQDENIIDVHLAVQYQIKDARNYLFSVRNPDATLKQATESALREVIGKSKMDYVLTEGRSEVVRDTQRRVQEILDDYDSGLALISVNLQDAQPPDEVQAAFADAIKAREDEQRQKNEAEAYKNEVIPKARGAAARMLQEASAYKEQVIAQSEGETKRFLALLTEYEKAPEITRERLYIESMEWVLSHTGKIMVDAKGGNQLLYLPIDKMMQRTTSIPQNSSGLPAITTQQSPMREVVENSGMGRTNERGRRTR